MEKLDLNISKYSCDELKEIFNIPENIDCDTLPKIIDSYKNNLFLEDNISLDQKNNITNFLNKVQEKLLSSTNNPSQMNKLISASPLSHPVIVNPNSLAGQESESIDGRPATFNDYPPGKINPINIKSIRRTLNIDSRFRPMYYSTKSSDFLVTVPAPFKKIVNMHFSIDSIIFNNNIIINHIFLFATKLSIVLATKYNKVQSYRMTPPLTVLQWLL